MKKDAERQAVFGMPGSGKSTLAMALVKPFKKVVVFDVQRDFTAKGVIRCTDRRDVLAAMKSGWRRGFKVSYVPPSGGEIEALHWLGKMCWAVQEPYEYEADDRKLALVIEEAHTALPNHELPGDLRGMMPVIRQGRHRGIEVIAVTQTPASLSSAFRGTAARTYVFALGDATAENAVLAKIGRQHKETLSGLKQHEFLLFERGELRKGRTCKNGTFRVD